MAKEDEVAMKDWMENFWPVRQRIVRSVRSFQSKQTEHSYVEFNREQATPGDSSAPNPVTETTQQSEHSPASSQFNLRKRPWLVALKCRYRTSSNKMSNEIDMERDGEVEVV